MTRKRRAAFTEEFRREAGKRAEKSGNTNASVLKIRDEGTPVPEPEPAVSLSLR